MSETSASNPRSIDVSASDLPLHCPMLSKQLWDAHPRVYLPIQETGEALCPYCGTQYVLKGSPVAGGH